MLSVHRLEALLYRHDPTGLRGHGAPADDYTPEDRTIAEHEARSVADVQRIMHEEFLNRFACLTYTHRATAQR